jgi:hypothetical protein
MKGKWVYPVTMPFLPQGRDLAEDNFAQEERSNLDILIREVLQNPLDAKAVDNSGPVRVRLTLLQPGKYDAEYLTELLDGEFGTRLEASGGDPLPALEEARVLVIEDFGTTGLEGAWDDENADGPTENWNAFWHREGEGAKATTGSNGRAGQGKITYYRISAARAVFGYTARRSDGQKLLMGRSAFRKVYLHQGRKFLRHSYWCTGEQKPVPIRDDEEIMRFRKAFALTRLNEPGLSLVVPFPTDFVPRDAIRTIVSDFYFPVAAGHLEVEVAGLDLNATTIDTVADKVFPDTEAKQLRSPFTSGFRKLVREVIAAQGSGEAVAELKSNWGTTTVIPHTALGEGVLERLRGLLDAGKRISVRFPIAVRPKRGDAVITSFEVHLEVPEDLERTEEAYIRRDLLIGAERHLAGSYCLQKARALTLIQDPSLSAFLADAEEPTHLKWNGSRPRLAEDYKSARDTLRAVRQAAPRLLALISDGMVKRDVKALAKYFSKPTEEGKVTSGGKKEGGRDIIQKASPPPPVRKPFRIVTGVDRIQVVPNGSASMSERQLPVTCLLEVAYEGLDLDAFKAYDPFDFDLAIDSVHPVAISGATIIERAGNRLRFEIENPAFSVEVAGFDTNIRLRARLSYQERGNGPIVSEE